MKTPTFTIIIPTFNSESKLPIALRSILEQKFQDFEVLVIDGLSTDTTMAIVEGYANKHPNIRWIAEKDKGIYDAMNKGIGLAKGAWVYFLGSDDKLRNEAVLDEVAQQLTDPSLQFVYGNVILNGQSYDGEFDLKKLFTKNISHQAIFNKRELFDSIGLYNLDYRMHADWDFNIRCFLAKVNMKHIPTLIAEFGPGGISAGHDIAFLRKALLPARIKEANADCVQWKSVAVYDDWWRLLRNTGIRDIAELDQLANGERVPAPLQRMINRQKKISVQSLKKGSVSKFNMFRSFLAELLKRS